MITNADIYRCYSDLLKNFLLSNNIQYFLVARDIVTGKKFYAFEKTAKFLYVLNQWNENNPKQQH